MLVKRKNRCHFISGKLVSCDTETTGVDPWTRGDRPFGFSFANKAGDKVYYEFPVDPTTRRVLYSRKPKAFAAIKRFYRDRSIVKVFHNAKFDVRMLERAGIKVRGRIEDTEFAMRVASPGELTHELKPLTKKYFDISDDDKKALRKGINALRLRAGRLGYKVATKKTHGSGYKNADYWLPQYAVDIMVGGLSKLKTYQNASANSRRKMEEAAAVKGRAMRQLCREYCLQDAERTMMLWLLAKQLLADTEQTHIYNEEMREVWPVTYAIESRGVYLDRGEVKAGRKTAAKLWEKAKGKINKICKGAKSKLNPDTFANSHPQKIEYFIKELGLEPLRRTKGNCYYCKGAGCKLCDFEGTNPQIDKGFFEYYETDVPLCRAMMDEERAGKALNTYFDNYLMAMDGRGVIHAGFQQIGAKTGRYSSRSPNFQNVPKRGKCQKCKSDLKITEWIGDKVRCAKCGEVGLLDVMMLVRKPFRPRPGFVWYASDYQQIEARIFADEAEEEFMIKAFRAGRDVYQEFADVIEAEAGVDIGRQIAKNIFLGKLYGLGLKKLIKTIMDVSAADVDEDDAAKVLEVFDETFPGVSGFMQDTIRSAKANGYVVNRYGQRIDVWKDEAYKGVNYIIQSSAARLMKRAMVKCHDYLQRLGYGWLVMTIHDELIFEFPENKRPRRVIKDLAGIMADNDGMFPHVETSVDVKKVVDNWLDSVPCEWATAN